jgi:TetR/AcrR family transcriptional regulator, transcriptional repressor for nem operon
MTAALDLMWDEGYSAVTIDEICARADVRKGSFYYFFKSKADLAVAALEKLWVDEWKPRLDREFSASVAPLDRIANYLGSLYTRQAENIKKHGKVLGCPVGSMGCEVSTLEAEVNAKVREIIAMKRRYFETAIRDGMADGSIGPGDPSQKAQSLEFLMQGALSEARIMNSSEILRSLPSTVLEMLKAKSATTVGAGT